MYSRVTALHQVYSQNYYYNNNNNNNSNNSCIQVSIFPMYRKQSEGFGAVLYFYFILCEKNDSIFGLGFFLNLILSFNKFVINEMVM